VYTLAAGAGLDDHTARALVNRVVPALAVLGSLRSRCGEPEACALLELTATLADGAAEIQYVVPASVALAEHHWFVGDPQARDAARARHRRGDVAPSVSRPPTWR
jgi:hypothetical protein